MVVSVLRTAATANRQEGGELANDACFPGCSGAQLGRNKEELNAYTRLIVLSEAGVPKW